MGLKFFFRPRRNIRKREVSHVYNSKFPQTVENVTVLSRWLAIQDFSLALNLARVQATANLVCPSSD